MHIYILFSTCLYQPLIATSFLALGFGVLGQLELFFDLLSSGRDKLVLLFGFEDVIDQFLFDLKALSSVFGSNSLRTVKLHSWFSSRKTLPVKRRW